jgi:hypothetical protein
MGTLGLPSDPVELAAKRAEENAFGDDFEMSDGDRSLLAELDHGAEQLGFHDQTYFLQAHRAVVVPVSFEADDPVTYINFNGISVEGTFTTYSKVHIGRLVGGNAVRALCLTLCNVTLLPFFDTLPESDLLHVPVLAVAEITSTN